VGLKNRIGRVRVIIDGLDSFTRSDFFLLLSTNYKKKTENKKLV